MAITTLAFTSSPLTSTVSAMMTTVPLGMVPLTGTISLSFDLSLPAFVDISIPRLIVSAQGAVENNRVDVTLPSFEVEAVGYTGIVGSVDVTLPSFIVESHILEISGSGDVRIPILRVSASGIVGIVGSVNVTIPKWIVLAPGFQNIVGTVGIELPPFIVDAYGRRISLVNYKTSVMNASNYGVTEYGRWNFNSYANLNGKLLAANGNGLFEAGGGKDGGQYGISIDSEMILGLTDMHKQIMKFAREAWFTVRADGDLALVLRLDEDTEYLYLLERIVGKENAHELRAKPGRGIRSRYISFGLKNLSGSYFMVESMRVYSDVSDRRIR